MNLLLDLFFPKRCVGCRQFGSYFCKECITEIKQGDLICPACEKLSVGGQTHLICKKRFGLNGLWSLGLYEGSLRSAITQLKYKWVRALAEELTNITIEYWAIYQPFLLDKIKQDYGQGWVIVPVPLSVWRQNWRGFNQSSLIGQSLSKKLGLDYCEGLKRIRHTKPQVSLKGYQRKQNIKGAFTTQEGIDFKKYPKILLLDDVWTTGSTMRECGYELKKAGAKQVWAITLAR